MDIKRLLNVSSRSATAAGAIVGFFIAGCGGSSTPNVDPGTVRSRVEQSLEEGFSSHQLAIGTNDPTRSNRSGEPIYDPFVELWIRFTDDGADFFTDQACTDAAGSMRITIEGNPESEPFIIRSTQTVDKGPRAGSRFDFEMRSENNVITISGTGTSPDSGPFTMSGTWNSNGEGSFVCSSQKPGEAQRTYRIVTRADGTSQVTFDNAQWHKYTLDFNADGSGSGTVTGSSDLLPASVVWNSDGDGTVTYKDGSTRTFDNFRFDG